METERCSIGMLCARTVFAFHPFKCSCIFGEDPVIDSFNPSLLKRMVVKSDSEERGIGAYGIFTL